MKKILLLLIVAFGLSQITKGQEVITTVDCDQTGMAVNVGSQEHMVSLYHGGPVYTMPSESNIVVWEITDMQGNLITKDTIVDDPHFIFYHDIAITDTINVSAHFTNHAAIHEGFPVNCLIEDQLYWEITEVIPPQELFPDGIYTESWTFVYENAGVDQNSLTDSCIAYPIEECISIALWDPVCGCDGVTYSNSGDAACNSIYDFTEGECNSQVGICTSNSGVQIIEIGFWENPNDPCDIGECNSDGQFIEIVIDCEEETGIPCNGEWIEVEGQCCSECLENVDLNEITNKEFRLIKMIDILGREKKEHKEGMILFYIYENGKVIKRMQ